MYVKQHVTIFMSPGPVSSSCSQTSKFEQAVESTSFSNCKHICNCQGTLNKQTAWSLSDPFGNCCIMYNGGIPIIKPQYRMSGLKAFWNTSRFCHKPSSAGATA